jgi:hypothetical protein
MSNTQQTGDGRIPPDALLRVWHRKLLDNFAEGQEYFNVYVDNPFCEAVECRFCGYGPNIVRSRSDKELKDRYYEKILIDHIREFREALSIRTPDSVYFGGGSSSLMSLAQMDRVFRELQGCFDFRNCVKEKTFECNPRHVTEERLQVLIDWNFTHVTIGIQTLDERVLKFNARRSPSLEQLTSMMGALEQSGLWYNVDLLAFIYRDDLEQDLAILASDLETVARMLHPKRITVYPNYYKLKDPEGSAENRDHTFTKIRKLREVVADFTIRNGYVEANTYMFETGDKDLYFHYNQQHSLIRADVEHRPDWKLYSCSGWPNTNYHQNVLAFGGYGSRRPYSYVSDKLCYETAAEDYGREYFLIFAEPELLCEISGKSRTTVVRCKFPNLPEGVPNKMHIYHIPATALDRYQDKAVTVRSRDADALVEAFSAVPQEKLLYLQVLSMDCDSDALLHLAESVPIDLVLENPAEEFSQLYRFAELPGKHPVRVTVRAAAGMTKAVKVAEALNFSVKLDVGQPDAAIAEELVALAEYYLRGANVTRPVEPLHSLFLSFFSGNATNLWQLLDEDPATDRYVSDDGRVAFSRRLAASGIPEDQLKTIVDQNIWAFRENDECSECEFFACCEGYFKLPDKSYQCDHVKRLLGLLREAAAELRCDEQRFVELSGKGSPAS